MRRNAKSFVSAFCLPLLFLSTAGVRAVHADGSPDYSNYTRSYLIPFAKPVNFNHLTSMHVRASLNGEPAMSLQVDTGSTGIVWIRASRT